MKRLCSILLICTLVIGCMCILSGCSEVMYLRLQEEELYAQKLEEFFSVLDSRDATAMRAMFSPTVQQENLQLDQQIEKLLSIYPVGSTQHYHDGMGSGHYSNEYGVHTARVMATVPVLIAGEYFWITLSYTYLDQENPDNVGIDKVVVYTMDAFCIRFQEGSFEESPDGLTVCDDQKLEGQMRCINRIPYVFTPNESVLDLMEVEDFLLENLDLTAFQQRFGQPNVQQVGICYYEVTAENGEKTYLELYFEGNHITQASLVGEFAWIRTIYTEYEE